MASTLVTSPYFVIGIGALVFYLLYRLDNDNFRNNAIMFFITLSGVAIGVSFGLLQERLKRIDQDKEEMLARLEIAMRDVFHTIQLYGDVRYPDYHDNIRYIFQARLLSWDTYLRTNTSSIDQIIDNPIAVRTLSPAALSDLFGLRSLRVSLFGDNSKFKEGAKAYEASGDPEEKKRIVKYAFESTNDFLEIMKRSFDILCIERNRINDNEPRTGNYFKINNASKPNCPDIGSRNLLPEPEPSS